MECRLHVCPIVMFGKSQESKTLEFDSIDEMYDGMYKELGCTFYNYKRYWKVLYRECNANKLFELLVKSIKHPERMYRFVCTTKLRHPSTEDKMW